MAAGMTEASPSFALPAIPSRQSLLIHSNVPNATRTEMVKWIWRSVFITCVSVTLVLFLLCDEERSAGVSGFTDAKAGACAVAETVYIDRKLKGKHDNTARSRKPNEALKEGIEEDYPEFDPVPSTKPAIKSGPIVHDTSVMPSIPRSKPPNHP